MSPRIRSALLPGAAMLLGIVVLLNGATHDAGAGHVPPPPVGDGTPARSAAAVEIVDERELLLARPIFTPGRVPPPAPAAVAETAQPDPAPVKAQFRIQGIARSADRVVVHVLDPATRKVRRLALGQEIGGWRIADVDATSVTFARDDASDRITIFPPPRSKGKTPSRR